MDKKFLKQGEVVLINGGYLSNKNSEPICNAEFVEAQQRIEFLDKFIQEAKKHDFEGKQAENFDNFRSNFIIDFSQTKDVSFINIPTKPKSKLQDELLAETLKFVNFEHEKELAKRINYHLQRFIIIKEFEEFGLFFTNDIVKLNKIYTLEEIIKIISENVELLDK